MFVPFILHILNILMTDGLEQICIVYIVPDMHFFDVANFVTMLLYRKIASFFF